MAVGMAVCGAVARASSVGQNRVLGPWYAMCRVCFWIESLVNSETGGVSLGLH